MRLVLPLLFGVIGTLILGSLGVWQLNRLSWKEETLARIEQQIEAPVQALPALEALSPEHSQYLPVVFNGTLTGEGIDVLVSRKEYGAGYRVIAVVETEQGRRLLVDRGFLPQAQRLAPHFPGQEAGQVIFEGNLLWPDEVDSFTPPPDSKSGIWFARDLPHMAQTLNTEPLLVVVRTPILGDKAIDPMPVDTAGIPNNHFGYALQWFGMAAVWFGMSCYFVWSIWRKKPLGADRPLSKIVSKEVK